MQLVEFADFECPYCAKFETTLEEVRSNHPSQIGVTFMHFPLSQHSSARQAALVAECANDQGHFDEMRSLLFREVGNFGSESWVEFGRRIAVPDIDEFERCIDESKHKPKIAKSIKLGEDIGVAGTPEVIVNGWALPRPPTRAELELIVANIVDGKEPTAGLEY